MNNDGQVNVQDLVLLINHFNGTTLLPTAVLPEADINGDGIVDKSDIDGLANLILGANPAVGAVTLDPTSGASDVGVTVRPKATFPRPVDVSTLNSNNFYASFAGRKLAATIVPAANGKFAWLFFDPPMPNSSQVLVTVDGSTITNLLGAQLDADGDGVPGGSISFNFSTVSVAPVPGTFLASKIVDPGPDLIPRTSDDVAPGPSGYNYLLPIAGVKVYMLGLESNFAYTDTNGNFVLSNMPVGDVKIVLDGRTALDPPAGYYFPEMVMDSTFLPGITNAVMPIVDTNGVVMRDANGVPIPAKAIYLPRVVASILQTVSASNVTIITLNTNAAYTNSPSQAQYLTIQIQPGSLIGMNGQPMASGQVGLSVVPPELVQDMLPPGLLQHTFDITVQAPGVATFTTPARMTFPNVFNAPPGTKLNFLSFDHTTGRLVIEGTGTVSADGLYVVTDPGTGVTHPGWHGLAPPGVSVSVPCNPPPVKPPDSACDPTGVGLSAAGVALGVVGLGLTGVASAPVLAAIGFAGIAVGAYDAWRGWNAQNNIEHALTLTSVGSSVTGTGLGFLPDYTPKYVTIIDNVWLGTTRQEVAGFVESSASKWGKYLGVFGIVLSAIDLYKRAGNCLSSSKAQPPLAASDLDAPAYFGGFLDEQSKAATNITAAFNSIYRAALGPFLPTTNQDLFVTTNGATLIFYDMQGNRLQRSDGSGDYVINISNVVAHIDLSNTNILTGLTELSTAAQQMSDAYSGLTNAGDYFNQVQLDYADFVKRTAAEGTPLSADLNGITYYLVLDENNKTISRGKLQNGKLSMFLAPSGTYVLELFNFDASSYAIATLQTGPSGSGQFAINGGGSQAIQTFVASNSLPDQDQDGLPDLAEAIIGTDPYKWSTAGDGVGDGEKVAQGLDPLSGGGLATGPISSLPLEGEAKEVVIAASPVNPGQRTAYLACGSRGLSIVNVSQFQRPIVLGQLDLPGDATGEAVEPTLQVALVAANAGGLHWVDVSNPMQPNLVRTISTNASAVQVIAGVAYAAVGNSVQAYDLLTGLFLQGLPLGANITGLASEGFLLYTMDTGNALRVIDISGDDMVTRGTLALPYGGGRLFVGVGIAYVAAASDLYGGFLTVNAADPDNLSLVGNSSAGPAAASPGPNVTVNGSGLALVTVTGGRGVAPCLQVYDVRNPTNTGAFVTRYPLSASPYSAAIGAGVAFVADGTAGLQVVNYLSLDTRTNPPTIVLSNSFIMTTPTNGIAVEGSGARVQAVVSDDVQVRNVEFYMDGGLVLSDQSFPFEYVFVTPAISTTRTNFTLQARAFDTGGNFSWTPLITVQLAPDTSPPRLRRNFPGATNVLDSVTNIYAYFNKPINGATINAATFTLTSAGPDHRLGTADDFLVTNGVVSFYSTFNAAMLSFATPLPIGVYRATLSTNVMDASGNAVSNAISWIFAVLPGGPDGDPDGDDLSNAQEIAKGTDPLNPDTDGDGWKDGVEVEDGKDPLDPKSRPSAPYLARPMVQVALPAPGESTKPGVGTTLASPPVEIMFQRGDEGGFPGSGTTLATPPLLISVSGALGMGTVLGYPPLQIVLPQSNETATPGAGTTIAYPPVIIQH